MGWFQKNGGPDPLSERARALNAEIAALEAQIKALEQTKPASNPPSPKSAPASSPAPPSQSAPAPRLRSTTVPHAATAIHTPPATAPAPPPNRPAEPIFEEVDHDRLKGRDGDATTREHYNSLGVRKYDLAALWQRLKNNFRGPSTANPKLVNYLAAGSIQGLRPMRYEKRVARNRFLFVAFSLLALLIGIFAWIRSHR